MGAADPGVAAAATPPTQPYDPGYDPLVHPTPGCGREYAPTYWVATAGPPPADDGPLRGDVDCDVAIVGAGFTGLACALVLAREHGIRATVLEANRVAWGCTSRNGGQGQNASGRLYRSQWIRRWGRETALKLDAEIREGFDTFRALVAQIDCDAQHGGHLVVAHRPAKLEWLRTEARVMREVFGYDARILSREEVAGRFVDDADGHQREARARGAAVHPASPVLAIDKAGGSYRLRTPGGTVRARAVGIATGGYTADGLHPSLARRIMPVLSNSLVTRPLTADEVEATRFRTTQVITDTRTLRFYYRRLPDGRVQIGSRSAITGADAAHPRHLALLVDGLHRKFPALRGIGVEHSWWGWVDVSHDMMPRVTQPDRGEQVFYALGYGGNGVSFSAHAGRRMAERIAGRRGPAEDLPIYGPPLEHPNLFGRVRSPAFAPFRRLGQRALSRWYAFGDERG
jgi:glycine/D-amino acid oxidase-like deaminating enzyme